MVLFASGALSLAGCTGNIAGDRGGSGSGGGKSSGSGQSPGSGSGSGQSGGNDPGSGNGSGSGPTVAPPEVNAGLTPLRRLTSTQYRNTVADLLGMEEALTLIGTEDLPSDDSVAGRFTSNTLNAVKGLDADKYADAAGRLAAKAVENLQAILPCDQAQATCGRQFIESFGRRAYRRPMTQTEVERYEGLFKVGTDFKTGAQLVIEAFLQSPKFLYLIEPVPEADAGKLLVVDNWVLASRLSYFLLQSMPDDKLFEAAERGRLGQPDGLAEEARRLMTLPRFGGAVRDFHFHWLETEEVLGAEKNPEVFPLWNPELQTALAEETQHFVDEVMVKGDGKLETLLTAGFTYLSGPLYELYGASGNGTAWTKADLDPKQRAGILTQAGMMAGLAHEDRTSFILRGKLVREALLCGEIPPPPDGVDASEMNIPATATAKERSEQHRTDPACASCHALFDPIGFGFEVYDAVGRFRDRDAMGNPIDSLVELTGTKGLDGSYPDAVGLMQKLASSEEVRSCFARQWLRFALGREVNDKSDASTLAAAFGALEGGDGKLGDLLVAVAQSDAMRHQKVNP